MTYWQTRHEPIVYYMVHANFRGAIKIGTTVNRDTRIARYIKNRNHGEYLMLAWERGDENVEAKRHHQFHRYLIQGEWFFYEGALKDHVEHLMNNEFEPQLQKGEAA